MKTTIKTILLAAVVAFGFASCQTKSVLDPLEDLWTKPTEVKMTTLAANERVREGDLRYFTVSLTAGSDKLDITLVGNKYFLEANTYSPSEKATAKNGNYVKGATTVNGKKVESGSVVVTQNGSDYTFDAMFFCEDGTPYRIYWAGKLEYEVEIDKIELTNCLNVAPLTMSWMGIMSVTLYLATDGITAGATGFGGTGKYLALDLYSADGKLHEGTYNPGASTFQVAAGQYTIGGEFDWAWMGGTGKQDVGTTLYTVNNGTATSEYITEGVAEVKKDGSNWIITHKTATREFSFTGVIPGM